MWDTVNKVIDFLANWFEVIGFAISIITAIKVFLIDRKIQNLSNSYLYHQRIGEHLKEFKNTSSILSSQLGNFSVNLKQIRLTVAQCEQNCRNLRAKSKRQKLSNLSIVIKAAVSIRKNRLDQGQKGGIFQKYKSPVTEKQIDTFYEKLALLIAEIEHLIQDNKKSFK
ncbi:hypothetical protein [Foetidibacter luteolus]|uniref:hypothetical protein n=1 Tax=Foetidibacter luteolus TaxID=2608880 RepID=UPI00129BC464|nr:hypothetical protein [Foetidibacter luteolus]